MAGRQAPSQPTESRQTSTYPQQGNTNWMLSPQRFSSCAEYPSSYENNVLNALIPAQRSMELHRLRRRRTQQRYRKKLQAKSISFEDEVIRLRKEVERLEKERNSIPINVATKTVPWKVVVEYFRLFRNGFNPIASVSDLCNAVSTVQQDPAYVQTQFFQAVMAPDVLFNVGHGVKAALENWRLVSLHHENHLYDLESVERGPGDSIVAYMTGSTTITKKMLLMAFPDLINANERSKLESLAAKLLGQRLVVPSRLHFLFDETHSRVVRARYEADMLTPLLKLLQSVDDVALVLSSALDIHHWSKPRDT